LLAWPCLDHLLCQAEAAAQVAAAREDAHKWEVAAKSADSRIKKVRAVKGM
jgi:hypothetical protein